MRDCVVAGQLLTTQSSLLTALYKRPFENIVKKEENVGNQHFFLFPHNVFCPVRDKSHHFRYI